MQLYLEELFTILAEKMKIHMVSHDKNSQKPYSCGVCGRGFSRKDYLESHSRLHTGFCPYVCDQCGMTFSERSNFRQHKRTHSEEKTFTCKVCGKGFNRNDHFEHHQMMHTKKQPFICEVRRCITLICF